MTKENVFEFGRKLVETGDLDPIYLLLWNSPTYMRGERLADWLVAYWCFYNVGTVNWILGHGKSCDPGYWDAMEAAADTAEHPRGTERRHFRGDNGRKAVSYLRSHAATCSELIESLRGGEDEPTRETVSRHVEEWEGFGPWIAFKVADMIERLDIFPVRFTPGDIFNLFDSPRKGAEAMAERYGPAPTPPYLWAYNRIIRQLGELQAPPRFERRINIQEVETILCKWKSHLSGHYEVGKDIEEIHKSLIKYRHCAYASVMLGTGHDLEWWEDKR